MGTPILLLWEALSILKFSVDLESGDGCELSYSGHLWPRPFLLCSHPFSLVEQGRKPVVFLEWKGGRPMETWVYSFILLVSILFLWDRTCVPSCESGRSLLINSPETRLFPRKHLEPFWLGCLWHLAKENSFSEPEGTLSSHSDDLCSQFGFLPFSLFSLCIYFYFLSRLIHKSQNGIIFFKLNNYKSVC